MFGLAMNFSMKTSETPKAVLVPPRPVGRGIECAGCPDHPHPSATTAHRRLDDHRVSERVGQGVCLGTGEDRRVAAREDRNARVSRQRPRGHFVAQPVEQLGTRTDEHDPGPVASPREFGILRQAAIARMDRVDFLCFASSTIASIFR
jgi:hypothetical protein